MNYNITQLLQALPIKKSKKKGRTGVADVVDYQTVSFWILLLHIFTMTLNYNFDEFLSMLKILNFLLLNSYYYFFLLNF